MENLAESAALRKVKNVNKSYNHHRGVIVNSVHCTMTEALSMHIGDVPETRLPLLQTIFPCFHPQPIYRAALSLDELYNTILNYAQCVHFSQSIHHVLQR